MMEELDLEKIVSDVLKDSYHVRENGMYLSDSQIEILKRNGFDYKKYASIKSLLFDIEDYLNQDIDDNSYDELDLLASQLAEVDYYQNTNK
ncbi:MAG: hypothetical protein E7168_02610 [Firmicutes bacterium]|nr:hypothetical protein [Bacillota bacterium]